MRTVTIPLEEYEKLKEDLAKSKENMAKVLETNPIIKVSVNNGVEAPMYLKELISTVENVASLYKKKFLDELRKVAELKAYTEKPALYRFWYKPSHIFRK